MLLDDALNYAETNMGTFEAQLTEYISYPTVSAQPKEHIEDFNGCRAFLKKQLGAIGFTNIQELKNMQNVADKGQPEKLEEKGQPALYAELTVDPSRPTVLIYSHMDVQPVETEKWRASPFEMKRASEGGREYFFGRGTSDDKGPGFALLKSIEALYNTKNLNVNFKVFIEGEEEGGGTVEDIIAKHEDILQCNAIVVSDAPWNDQVTPTILTGLKGIYYGFARSQGEQAYKNLINSIFYAFRGLGAEVTMEGVLEGYQPLDEKEISELGKGPADMEKYSKFGQDHLLCNLDKTEILHAVGAKPTFEVHGFKTDSVSVDKEGKKQYTLTNKEDGVHYVTVRINGAGEPLHSGLFGGAAINPHLRMVEALSGLDDDVTILDIDGGYRSAGAKTEIPEFSRATLAVRGIDTLENAIGFIKAAAIRGYTGKSGEEFDNLSGKGIIEIKAYEGEQVPVLPKGVEAKISSRMVRGQHPEKVSKSIESFFEEGSDGAVKVETAVSDGSFSADMQNPYIERAKEALTETFNKEAVFAMLGGSIPAVGYLSKHLKVPVVLFNTTGPDDRIHGHNERWETRQWKGAVMGGIRYFDKLRDLSK